MVKPFGIVVFDHVRPPFCEKYEPQVPSPRM